jgi:hypothetical protein
MSLTHGRATAVARWLGAISARGHISPMLGETAGTRVDAPRSTYREFAPPPALAGHVLCLRSQPIGVGDRAHRQRVLPDGCIDLVWIGPQP